MILPLLGGWFSGDTIEGVMKEHGFRLKKKQTLPLANSNQQTNHYIFIHRMYKAVIIDEYSNGLVEITTQYQAHRKDNPQWQGNISQVVERGNFRQTINKFFMTGAY
jgi:hypothetical protein